MTQLTLKIKSPDSLNLTAEEVEMVLRNWFGNMGITVEEVEK